MVNLINYENILSELKPFNAKLVAISKTKTAEDINTLINHGQKAFGENYVQELVEKNEIIPDAEWHFVGHLQTNKVKFISPFIHLIHGVDSISILKEINKQAEKSRRIQECLLQIHIAKEETKFGFSFEETDLLLNSNEINSLRNINVKGFMGMTTATDDIIQIRKEFSSLKIFFDKYKSSDFSILSMGMTSDYKIALEEGSTMVRIGSAIFGERN